ncbi:MAG: hypothetical protein WCZ27_11115 [Tissierellaceae bacterium]
MEIVKDILAVNKQVLKKSIASLRDNWIIIFTGMVYVIINIIALLLVFTIFTGLLSIFAGIAVAVLSASLISNYFYLLFNVINYNRVTFQDFKDGFKYFLRKIYTVLFFAWIGTYFLGILQGMLGFNALILDLIIKLSVFILLNALPETLYLKVLEPMDSIMYAVDFIRENIINWAIPNLIFYLLLYSITGKLIVDIFAIHINASLGLDGLVRYLLGQVVFSFIMIYRGHLYKLLSTSTRRKRMFMNKF